MSIKFRLVLMNFLEFFVWGAWLISMGRYMGATLHFTGSQIGDIYGTMGVASLFMPGLLGIVADRWLNAERVLGLCHLLGAVLLIWASTVTSYSMLYVIMLLNSMFYMPTIALNNTVSYIVMEKKGFNIVKEFPPVRVWGTVGFICAMWVVDLLNWTASARQLYISAGAGLVLGIYAFTMPSCEPVRTGRKKSLVSSLGLDAFVLFRNSKIAVFFLFSMFLGAALQITNAFGLAFLGDFANDPSYAKTFAVVHPNILASISQVSETLFILAIPFFLRRFGIKTVMLISIFAWVFRFGLFGIGNPGGGLVFLVLSMIVYGMAFDFFNISGSLFIEKESPITMRASAQGLFMIMTNGFGAWFGT
ncbi:MAG: nucleoside permease, partial [Bacteroidetes bacterium]|nr:nucleoside permease [Bacteroidota bacterium]